MRRNFRPKWKPIESPVNNSATNRLLATFATALMLAGCAQNPPHVAQEAPQPAPPEEVVEIEKVEDRRFSTETLYALLVAEMAIDRRRYDIALGNYVQQASATRDPGVTARATQIARILKAHKPALEMAELWVDLEPASTDAQLIVTAELIEANRLDEAYEHAETLLEQGHRTAFDAIAVKAIEGDAATVKMLESRYQTLAERHPGDSRILLGLSILQQKTGDLDAALLNARKAVTAEPDNIRAAFQETRVLQQMGRGEQAVERLAQLVDDNPENRGLRARYARIVAAHDLAEAQQQFEILLQQSPNDPDILLSLALVQKERGNLDEAAQNFDRLIVRGQHVSTSHFQVGQILESQGAPVQALEHYRQVVPSNNYLDAMLRATAIMVEQQRDQEALEMLQLRRPNVSGPLREGLYILESDVHSSVGRMQDAANVLSTGIDEFPDSSKLLYARAMLFARFDSIAEAERDLRAVLALVPDSAAALNALGYTLVDRTDRIEEAYDYIKRAFELTPNDPAVLDSMGWAEYRMGNNQEALKKLRRAMDAMPDHEIAAHLGEVLWVTGSREEAKTVWRRGLKLKSDSKVIQNTIERFGVKL